MSFEKYRHTAELRTWDVNLPMTSRLCYSCFDRLNDESCDRLPLYKPIWSRYVLQYILMTDNRQRASLSMFQDGQTLTFPGTPVN